MPLADFPRVSLAHLPTPLERLDNLTRHLGGAEIWIKRDDCTGLSTGGNKARKLEYLMAEALAAGASLVVTHGATQSNHARQTAAAAARLGLACHLILEDRTERSDASYRTNGNILLDQLHGATIEHCAPNADMNGWLAERAERLRAEGIGVFAIPGGGSNPTGALGYVHAAGELLGQAGAIGLDIDHIVHATGSAGTQAGLVAGLAALGSEIPLLGISVRATREAQEENVYKLACLVGEKLGLARPIRREAVRANGDYVGPGYGHPAPGTIEAIRLLARLEGILLDPVYSGKGMAGLIDLVRTGHFARGERIVFLHTGGSASLFSYDRDLRAHG